MNFEQKLIWALEKAGLPTAGAAQMAAFNDTLLKVNEQINLTAVTDPDEMICKHYVDSLLGLKADIPAGASVLDVGCGAGFPSVPLMLARPDLRFTLLDALQKRLTFLENALQTPPTLVHGRAEQLGRDPAYRERFDVVVARAVAALPALAEYCLPFVRVGGKFLAYKGPDGAAELERATRAIEMLGGALLNAYEFTLETGQTRLILAIGKISPTPARFPRTAKKIKEKTL